MVEKPTWIIIDDMSLSCKNYTIDKNINGEIRINLHNIYFKNKEDVIKFAKNILERVS